MRVLLAQCFFFSGTIVLTFATLPKTVFAEDSAACDSSCDSGYGLISYADGNSVSCACVAEGQMEPTVPDPDVIRAPINQDE